MSILDHLNLPDAPDRPKQKWAPEFKSRHNAAEIEAKAIAENWQQVKQLVSAREELCCRVCGKRTNPHASTLLGKGHHHHIVYRSDVGGDTVQNVCLLCAGCHDEEHVKKTLHIEGNAQAEP